MSKKPNSFEVPTKIRSELGAKHKKPHLHAWYSGCEASIDFDGNLLAGKLPPKQLKSAIQYIRLNQQKLYAEWDEKNPRN